jgi:tetratricopeptide (TPR) repeat protein
MLVGLGRYKEAIADYDQAIEYDTKDGDLYRRRANARRLIGKTGAAIRDLNKSLSLQPLNALSYGILGIIWFNKKDYGRAIANLAQAHVFEPDKIAVELPEAYLYMGEAYRQKDFTENALDSYETFLRLNPDSELAHIAEKAIKELKNN